MMQLKCGIIHVALLTTWNPIRCTARLYAAMLRIFPSASTKGVGLMLVSTMVSPSSSSLKFHSGYSPVSHARLMRKCSIGRSIIGCSSILSKSSLAASHVKQVPYIVIYVNKLHFNTMQHISIQLSIDDENTYCISCTHEFAFFPVSQPCSKYRLDAAHKSITTLDCFTSSILLSQGLGDYGDALMPKLHLQPAVVLLHVGRKLLLAEDWQESSQLPSTFLVSPPLLQVGCWNCHHYNVSQCTTIDYNPQQQITINHRSTCTCAIRTIQWVAQTLLANDDFIWVEKDSTDCKVFANPLLGHWPPCSIVEVWKVPFKVIWEHVMPPFQLFLCDLELVGLRCFNGSAFGKSSQREWISFLMDVMLQGPSNKTWFKLLKRSIQQ